jgi:hypothetical protein
MKCTEAFSGGSRPIMYIGNVAFVRSNNVGSRVLYINYNGVNTFASTIYTIGLANTWYHFVLTIKKVNISGVNKANFSVYVNKTYYTFDNSNINWIELGNNIQINGNVYGEFPKDIDDLRIYDKELTQEEVDILYDYNKNNYNIKVINNNSQLSFQINNTPIYETIFNLNNTWNHIIWNIKNSSSALPFIRINNGTKQTFNQVSLLSTLYTNYLGSGLLTNSGSLYISDFIILTYPITETIENELYNQSSSIILADVNGIINANSFSGSGDLLYNLNSSNINTGTLSVSYGGTGVTTLRSGQLLIGNGSNALLQSANLIWDNINSRVGIAKTNPTSMFVPVPKVVPSVLIAVISDGTSGAANVAPPPY